MTQIHFHRLKHLLTITLINSQSINITTVTVVYFLRFTPSLPRDSLTLEINLGTWVYAFLSDIFYLALFMFIKLHLFLLLFKNFKIIVDSQKVSF